MKRNGEKAGEMVREKKLCPMISRTRGKQDFTLASFWNLEQRPLCKASSWGITNKAER